MRRVTIGVIAALTAVVSLAAPSAAQDDGPSTTVDGTTTTEGSTTDPEPAASTADAGVAIIEVSGLLDPVLVDFIHGALDEAEDVGALGLVLQTNLRGAVVSDEQVLELAERFATSSVPVYLWIGPSGADLKGAPAQWAAVVGATGISPGSRFGELGPSIYPDETVLEDAFGESLSFLTNNTMGADEAIGAGVATNAPVLGQFLLDDVEGFESEIIVGEDGEEARVPVTRTAFVGMSLLDQLFHTMASPAVAYLLFLIGMGLLVFELYTAGVGIAGVVGAFCFLGGCYGLEVLPARGWAVALLVLSMFAFAVDIQTGVARVWTGIGVAALTIGSVQLFSEYDFSWITLLAGVGLTALAMISGMPAMVRTRFSTPTIGREWMIGEMGEAVEAVDPEGRVQIRDALWRARTNRATPIELGDPVRVVAIEGLLLEVEPEEGAARDYRDRSPRD